MPRPAPTTDDRPLLVFSSHRTPAPRVSYIDQVVGDGSQGIDFNFFRGVLRQTEMDVVHLARPDIFLASTRGRRRSLKQRVLAAALPVVRAVTLAVTLRRHRIALVQTLHGRAARRRGGWVTRLPRRILDAATTSFVVVDPTTTVPRGKPVTHIPFGEYRERFEGYPRAEQVQGRLLVVGPELGRRDVAPVTLAPLTDLAELTFRVVGSLTDPVAVTTVNEAMTRCPAVSARDERVSDGTMVQEISASELVLISRTDELDELSTVFMALSLDRPVLVPDSPAIRRVADSVGTGWVLTYEGGLSAEGLEAAVTALRAAPPTGRPNLEGRDPATTSAAYARVFRDAAAKAGPRR